MFLFVINYCTDMLRPQFLAIFRELASLVTYTAYVVTCAEEEYQGLKVIKFKTFISLKSVCG
jgi:hypothetical protein